MAKTKHAKSETIPPKRETKRTQGATFALADGSTVPLADVAHITPDLRPLAVPIGSLKPDPRNARTHGEKNRAAIQQTLREDGQQKPIVVDGNGIIVAGNGTWHEAKAIGWKYIARVRTQLTGAKARRWAIRDNRTAELAEWDQEELDRTTEELAAEFEDFKVDDLGFSDDELKALADGDFETAHGFAPKPPPKDPPAGEQSYPAVFKIILTCKE